MPCIPCVGLCASYEAPWPRTPWLCVPRAHCWLSTQDWARWKALCCRLRHGAVLCQHCSPRRTEPSRPLLHQSGLLNLYGRPRFALQSFWGAAPAWRCLPYGWLCGDTGRCHKSPSLPWLLSYSGTGSPAQPHGSRDVGWWPGDGIPSPLGCPSRAGGDVAAAVMSQCLRGPCLRLCPLAWPGHVSLWRHMGLGCRMGLG